MDGHRAAPASFLAGITLVIGVIVVALIPSRDVLRSSGGIAVMILGLSVLFGLGLAAAVGHWWASASSGSSRQPREVLERLRGSPVKHTARHRRYPLGLVERRPQLLVQNRGDEGGGGCQRMQPQLIDLMRLAETAMRMACLKAYQAEVALRLDGPADPPRVAGEPSCLLEAVKHLLDQAIDFSPRGGTIQVRVYSTEDEACVEIADQGIAVLASQLERMFSGSRQAQGRGLGQQQSGGAGRGLTVAHAAARAHGGRVWGTGRARGSVFTLALPSRLSDSLQCVS